MSETEPWVRPAKEKIIVLSQHLEANRDTDPEVSSRHRDPDVFLCYNPADEAAARALEKQLQARGIVVWLDSWQPGKPLLQQQREQIASITSAVVLVGKNGIATFQQMLGFRLLASICRAAR